jgi:RimJ/RimL family protein N-acetyltransferase
MFPSITHDDVFRIETPRLWLRWPQLGDAKAVADYARHREVAEMTASIPHPYPSHQALETIREIRRSNGSGQTLELLISRKGHPQQVIGTVLARFPNSEQRDAETAESKQEPNREPMIGYALHPDHWSQGYASEAAHGLIEAVFTLTPATGTIATVRADNPASRHVLEKLGFEWVGERTAHAPLRAHPALMHDFRLDRAAWQGFAGETVTPLVWTRPYDWTEWAGAA